MGRDGIRTEQFRGGAVQVGRSRRSVRCCREVLALRTLRRVTGLGDFCADGAGVPRIRIMILRVLPYRITAVRRTPRVRAVPRVVLRVLRVELAATVAAGHRLVGARPG